MSASWVFFIIIILFTWCEAGLQADGRHFEHPLWFKVRILNLKSGSDEKYLQFAVTSGKKGFKFLGFWVVYIG